MKTKWTRKFTKQFCDTTIEINYCGLQHLLSGLNPDGYTCGVYGWNADIYYLGNHTAIVTGYRPFGNVKPKYDVVQRYEDRAKAICDANRWGDYEKRQKELGVLLDEFVAEVTR